MPKSKDSIDNLKQKIARLNTHNRKLEKELTSALEHHTKAMIQRDHAEEMTKHFYEAIRRTLMMVKQRP